MGMIANYLRVSANELDTYLNDSSKLEDRIYNETDHNDPNHIDIDKTWEGLFFLLTGKSLKNESEAAPPLAWMLSAPQEIDPDQDLGYGPAHYTTPSETKEVDQALSKISEQELKDKFDGKVMTSLEIYPTIWDEGDDALDYLLEYFHDLKMFYSKAAAEDQAVIIFIN